MSVKHFRDDSHYGLVPRSNSSIDMSMETVDLSRATWSLLLCRFFQILVHQLGQPRRLSLRQ